MSLLDVYNRRSQAIYACSEAIRSLDLASGELVGQKGVGADKLRTRIAETKLRYVSLRTTLQKAVLINQPNIDGSGGSSFSGGGTESSASGSGGGFST